MEGFHMFQDKIQSELNNEYVGYEMPLDCITSRSHLYMDFDVEDFETLPQGLHFSLEYQKESDALQMKVEDFHEMMCAFGNDIEVEGKKILLFYE
ncbi:MAG: hypothetical protein S4CHLAM37_16480 [Chlamydiia bacterium]|nr:hypothetical protein [Chlamydiia bacterium]